jgi:hypothetical protein
MGLLAPLALLSVLACATPASPAATMAAAAPSADHLLASAGAVPAPGPSGPERTASRAVEAYTAVVAVRLPAATSRSVAFADGSAILVCGGLTDSGTTAALLRIDPQAGRVAFVGRLAQAVHDAGGALLGGAPLVIGGGSVVAGTTVQRIETGGRTVLVGRLPAPRADLGAVAVNGMVVVVGGGTPSAPDPRVLATSDGVHFATVATLRVAVRYPAVAALGGLVFVIGGTDRSGDVADIQAVDIATGAVRIIGRLPGGLSDAVALVLDGRLIVAGGRAGGRAQDAVWDLDTTTGAVTRIGRLPAPVADAAGVVVGGMGYLVGGEAGTRLASIVSLTVR